MKVLDIESFKKNHEYLLCIDSDGTAIDAMNAKHKLCHGPAFIHCWELDNHKEIIQQKWNEINLYRKTRGVNRFIALVEILTYLQNDYISEPDIDILRNWVNNTKDLSNKGLEKEYAKTKSTLLGKALVWSNDINRRISKLSYLDKIPFEGVKEFLQFANGQVNIAVISSSNMSAIYEEWEKHDLLQYLDVMTSQEIGTKSDCIKQMLDKGFPPQNVLMIGDAIPDFTAASDNETYFYPILTGNESLSWKTLLDKYFSTFIRGNFEKEQENLVNIFNNNFKQERKEKDES